MIVHSCPMCLVLARFPRSDIFHGSSRAKGRQVSFLSCCNHLRSRAFALANCVGAEPNNFSTRGSARAQHSENIFRFRQAHVSPRLAAISRRAAIVNPPCKKWRFDSEASGRTIGVSGDTETHALLSTGERVLLHAAVDPCSTARRIPINEDRLAWLEMRAGGGQE